jgi:hypothetical protein
MYASVDCRCSPVDDAPSTTAITLTSLLYAQMDDGFVLTCVATALTDCAIEVDIEDLFYNLNPDMVEE